MARSHVYKVLQNTDGAVVTGASVQVNDDSGSPTAQTLYSGESGGTTLANPFTASSGAIEFWLAAPERLSLVITPPGGPAATYVVDAHPAAQQEIVDTAAPLVISNAPATGLVLTGTGTTTATWQALPNLGAPNAQTANYTAVLADANRVIEMSATTATTVTIPNNSTVAFAIGDCIEIDNMNTGAVTIVGASGVVIHSQAGANRIVVQYGVASLRKRATNEWVMTGVLST